MGDVARRLVTRLMPCVLLVAFVPMVVSCSTNYCGPSPKLLATWPGHSYLIYACGGFGPLTSTDTPAGSASDVAPAQIVLAVGQQLRIAKQGDWSGYHVSDPISDRPQVLRLTTGASGKVAGVYTAVGVGFADVGAKVLELCEGICYFVEVQVTS
jgi:hypothetical protein